MNSSIFITDSTSELEKLIIDNLCQEELDNSFLARELCLSEAQFYRKVKREFNCSPNILIRNIRLKKAFSMLQQEKEKSSVRKVAFSVGFSHVGYFIRRFEEKFGQSPGQLLKSKAMLA